MAAQGENKEGTFCARCFAHVAPGEAYCPECGAPTGEAAPGADSAVHRELAGANLLRLRGDLDGSEKALLSILRRFPNDPHAHEMLGDVCAERGEGDRAKEWYELALDLSPNSSDVRRKLQEAGDHVEARETADTAEVLGLPPAKPIAAWWPLALAGGLLALAIAVAAWPRSPGPAPLRATVNALAPEVPPASNDPAPTPPPLVVVPPPTTPSGTEADRQLLATLQKGTEGSRVQNVVMDPRSGALDVTFEVAETDDAKGLALALGKEALAAAPAAMVTTLRAVHAGRLVFAADLVRAGMDGENPLTNVWPAPVETPPSTTGAPSEPPAVVGAAPGGETPPSAPTAGGATGP